MRTAARSLEIARARGAAPGHGGGRVRPIAGAEAGSPPSRQPGCVSSYVARGELPHHDPTPARGFGLPSIWEAVQWCGAERLGHGGADHRRHGGPSPTAWPGLGRLASFVRDRRIPLEMWPDLETCIPARPASIKEHPIGPLRRLSFRVTVNTDNRLMRRRDAGRVKFATLGEAFGYGLVGHPVADDQCDERGAFAPFDERLELIQHRDQAGVSRPRIGTGRSHLQPRQLACRPVSWPSRQLASQTWFAARVGQSQMTFVAGEGLGFVERRQLRFGRCGRCCTALPGVERGRWRWAGSPDWPPGRSRRTPSWPRSTWPCGMVDSDHAWKARTRRVRLRGLCAKAVRPDPADFGRGRPVAAVCVYPDPGSLSLRRSSCPPPGSGRSVAGGVGGDPRFPSGRGVAGGGSWPTTADAVAGRCRTRSDMVIDRGCVPFPAGTARSTRRSGAVKEACGSAHLKGDPGDR